MKIEQGASFLAVAAGSSFALDMIGKNADPTKYFKNARYAMAGVSLVYLLGSETINDKLREYPIAGGVVDGLFASMLANMVTSIIVSSDTWKAKHLTPITGATQEETDKKRAAYVRKIKWITLGIVCTVYLGAKYAETELFSR